jgi:DUF971 family protein
MAASTTPTQVSVDTADQVITISWADDQTSVYPMDGLRRACPCAKCHGGHGTGYDLQAAAEGLDAEPDREWTEVRVETVGSYGLRITWDDGHNDGIYAWKRLRALDEARPA